LARRLLRKNGCSNGNNRSLLTNGTTSPRYTPDQLVTNKTNLTLSPLPRSKIGCLPDLAVPLGISSQCFVKPVVMVAVLGQGLVFGLFHSYQGWTNVIVISVLGVLYGILAAWRKNLRANVVAHAWSDIWGGWLQMLVFR
jgi:hypothetical protein